MNKQLSKSFLTIPIVAISAIMVIGIGYAISQTMMMPGPQMNPNPDMMQSQEQQNRQDAGQMMQISRGYVAALGGQNEIPPTNTQASGRAEVSQENQNATMNFALIVSNINNMTAAHIHLGNMNENGPIVARMFPKSNQSASIPGNTEGMILKGMITNQDLVGPLQGKTISDIEKEISAGNAYVNIHTTQNPDGEIRGQLQLTQQKASDSATTN